MRVIDVGCQGVLGLVGAVQLVAKVLHEAVQQLLHIILEIIYIITKMAATKDATLPRHSWARHVYGGLCCGDASAPPRSASHWR